MKQVSSNLRLELAQYRELLAFTQFGSDLDGDSKRRIEKGKRIIEVLKQEQYVPMSVEKQIIMLYATTNGFLDNIKVKNVRRFEEELLEYVDTHYRDLLKDIAKQKRITVEIKNEIEKCINDFNRGFINE